jgi:hypothetical protein
MAASVAIPGEGIYQQQQLQAENAYNQAKAALEAKRNQTYQQYGFLPTGEVDPKNPTGTYQVMRHDQAQELDNARESALGRGLGSTGLGAQVANAPRFHQEADSADMMRTYLGSLSDVDQGLLQALQQKNDRLLQARQDQINSAMSSGMWGSGGIGGYGGDGSGGGAGPLQWSDGAHDALARSGYSDEQIANAVYSTMTQRGWGPYNGGEAPKVQQNGQVFHDGGGAYIMVKVGTPQGTSTEKVYIGDPGGGQTTQSAARPPGPTPGAPPPPQRSTTTVSPSANATTLAQYAAAFKAAAAAAPKKKTTGKGQT